VQNSSRVFVKLPIENGMPYSLIRIWHPKKKIRRKRCTIILFLKFLEFLIKNWAKKLFYVKNRQN